MVCGIEDYGQISLKLFWYSERNEYKPGDQRLARNGPSPQSGMCLLRCQKLPPILVTAAPGQSETVPR